MKKLCFRPFIVWPLFSIMSFVLAGSCCCGQGNNPENKMILNQQTVLFPDSNLLSGDTSLHQLVTPVDAPVNHNKPDLLNPMLQNRVITTNDSVYNNIFPLKEYHLE